MKLRLENFDTRRPAELAPDTGLAATDEARLAAYDQGYAAGWDDSVAAAAQDQTRLQADLARHLQELGFTYHEARAEVLRTLEPLIEAVVGRILPAMARPALGALVVETLRPLAAQLARPPIRLTLHPQARQAVEPMLLMEPSLSVQIVEDDTLSPTEARMVLDDAECRLDLDATVAAIAAATSDFFTVMQDKETAHG